MCMTIFYYPIAWCLLTSVAQELEDVLAGLSRYENAQQKERREQEELAKIRRDQRRITREVCTLLAKVKIED